jgi:hypothetical protein
MAISTSSSPTLPGVCERAGMDEAYLDVTADVDVMLEELRATGTREFIESESLAHASYLSLNQLPE